MCSPVAEATKWISDQNTLVMHLRKFTKQWLTVGYSINGLSPSPEISDLEISHNENFLVNANGVTSWMTMIVELSFIKYSGCFIKPPVWAILFRFHLRTLYLIDWGTETERRVTCSKSHGWLVVLLDWNPQPSCLTTRFSCFWGQAVEVEDAICSHPIH